MTSFARFEADAPSSRPGWSATDCNAARSSSTIRSATARSSAERVRK